MCLVCSSSQSVNSRRSPRPNWGGFASQVRAVASLPSPPCSSYLKRSGGTMPACSVAIRHHCKRSVPPVTVSAFCGKPPSLRPPPVGQASTVSHSPTVKCLPCGKPAPAPQWGAGWGQVCPHLAFACNWGRIAPKPPPQENKTRLKKPCFVFLLKS